MSSSGSVRLRYEKCLEFWGNASVQLRYGSKVVPLTAKGDKNSIEVRDADEMIDVLQKLEQAITAGELDSQIQVASELLRAKFKK